MGFVSSSTLAAAATINTTATMFNIPLGVVDTEQSQALPANTKGFILKTRGSSVLKLAFTTGESGTKFVTIPAQGVLENLNNWVSQTLYFQSPSTSDVVELLTFQ